MKEDEERECLIKVVEYLQPLMSKELLCKFPDNSAFDFDYTQSSIWSPLVPPPSNPMDLDLSLITPMKLSFDSEMGFEDMSKSKNNKNSSLKKKIFNHGFDLGFSFDILNSNKKKKKKMIMMKKMKMKIVSDFSPTPVKKGCFSFTTSNKGWRKVRKAATKHFKKKKKDPMDQVKLSNYLKHERIQ